VTALTTWVPWATSLGARVTAQEAGRVFTGDKPVRQLSVATKALGQNAPAIAAAVFGR
jgi:hypothetical protein